MSVPILAMVSFTKYFLRNAGKRASANPLAPGVIGKMRIHHMRSWRIIISTWPSVGPNAMMIKLMTAKRAIQEKKVAINAGIQNLDPFALSSLLATMTSSPHSLAGSFHRLRTGRLNNILMEPLIHCGRINKPTKTTAAQMNRMIKEVII
jgi:hypothetical protein